MMMMSKKTKRMIKRVAMAVYTTLISLLMVWMLWSWADIVADNADDNPVHSEYNFFIVCANSRK
jgi:hypothetical protein